jgi:2-iminoacetate synthase ThiH
LIENAKRVNEKYHLFPHINPGLMSRNEIKEYRQQSPSGGLMLESFSKNLSQKGKAHYGAKTKNINLRLETLENAMSEKYPMTTGLLLGITDTKNEIIQDIYQLIKTCEVNTSIQEVILQNFRAKQNTLMKNHSEIVNDLFMRIDWVNPDHNWPNLIELKNVIKQTDQNLIPRLPVYPSYINKDWLSPSIYEKVSSVVNENGYPKEHEFTK